MRRQWAARNYERGFRMIKPMLAGKLTDFDSLSYPVLVSPKLDGVRCLIINGTPMSRNMKPIPNLAVRSILGGLPPMDGELIVGEPRAPDAFNRTQSGVMSTEGIPHFRYWVFDCLTTAQYPFTQRLELAKSYALSSGKNVEYVAHKLIKSTEGLLEYEAKMLLAGYEGIMVRSPDGPYKHGRSTEREGWLLKLKRFEDSEAEVIGFIEKERNDNELTTDALGRAKRSSHKAGKRAADTLGALIVQDVVTGQRFNIGTGFSEAERTDIWERRGQILGKVAAYRYQPAGVKDAPRFPTWLGWRNDL
jgi:DNA ligase 1